MSQGATFFISTFQVRRAERLGLKTPPSGFYRLDKGGKYRNLDNNRLYAKSTVENARSGRPAGRKGWDSLSPAYRRRLEKAGIGRRQYNAGAKIQKARGHINETLPRALRTYTTKGDTDFYRVPDDDKLLGRLLAYLLARGYTGVRAIYQTTDNLGGEVSVSRESSNWMRLDDFNLSRITERLINEPVKSSSDVNKRFSRSEMILLAVVPTKAKKAR